MPSSLLGSNHHSESSWKKLEKDLRHPLLLRQLEKVKQHRVQASSSDFSVRYIHLALTQNPNEMIIQFHTFGYDENKVGKPLAIIGKSEQELQSNPQWYGVGAVTTSYGESSVTGFDHAILLNNLTFDTTYYYRVGFGNVVNGKPVFTVQSDSTHYFTTRSKDISEVTIVIFGDMGIFFCESNIERISKIVKDNTGNGNFFIYHVGDISYADSYPGFMYQYVWDKFFEHWEGVQPYVPYMTTVGNHEYGPRLGPDKHSFEYNFTAYNHKFWMPLRNDTKYGHNMWYHFDFGPVRIVAIDTETNYPNAPFQPVFQGDHVSYVKNAIMNANRTQTPFLMTVGHRPIYSTEKGFSDANGNVVGDSKILQELFENDYKKYRVDMAICGHVHAYERQYPIYNGTIEQDQLKDPHNYINPQDTIYIVDGSGGSLGGMDPTHDFNTNIKWNYMRYNNDEGFGLLKIKRDSLTTFTVNFQQFNDRGEVIDYFTMRKTQP
ncbi:hypothetical protein C9374_013165 [Naegleria lovaniensis]|uniref:Purple acid phosphatase n=1 Tax=Naegleria lovaniensis TaxID=51637 RepID=A0AA88KDZ7_NAELO|nr:uncharacterized protein C9374_013165 [Naegleria lovaniensis]KAG2372801.1 hypothetical protein C9374_013165 [Naegleria lovaniensis]